MVTRRDPKSVSRETTFEDDLHPVRDRERLSGIFTSLCAKVADDLRRKGYVGRTIGLKLRYDNFKTVTRDLTLDVPTRDAAAWALSELLHQLIGGRSCARSMPDGLAKHTMSRNGNAAERTL